MLYRLGEVDKALYHYKQSGPEADLHDVSQAQGVQRHLNKCTEAKRLRDWNTLLKVTDLTISTGADSALQVSITVSIGALISVNICNALALTCISLCSAKRYSL